MVNYSPMRQEDTTHRQVIGVISDTHGLLRMEAIQAFKGCDLILHAGDVGKPHVLEVLQQTAPVIAVRGNVDRDEWSDRLPETATAEVGGVKFYLIHDALHLDIDPAAAGYRVVISGHTHKPAITQRSGVIYLNPGSAGPRRFRNPVSAALLFVEEEQVEVKLLNLVDLSEPS
jgi:uncharacterized protein